MGDERERMAQDIDALKARLLKVTKQWEALYGVLFVKAQRLSDDNAALRAALQAVLDAVTPFDVRSARAAAVALLAGPETELTGENLRDSGMAQPGGVSDGPQ